MTKDGVGGFIGLQRCEVEVEVGFPLVYEGEVRVLLWRGKEGAPSRNGVLEGFLV